MAALEFVWDRFVRLPLRPFGFSVKRVTWSFQGFAYNEASFCKWSNVASVGSSPEGSVRQLVLVRILQTFDMFQLYQKEDAPVGSTPPPEPQDAGGRYAVEQACPRQAVALYFKASPMTDLNKSIAQPLYRGECGSGCDLLKRLSMIYDE